ncbi:hypothetical protein [Streptomyces natalensis]|uniref:Uncharacterized protein n=1 Tax=Streptomyces natalensis ATCC 27448 TaxID=1240678 RepID=A0A0D7CRC8_9ACTN|nr:hypothetical protein [Streptomyces natalensis]KIZ18415.1 hypothetical protein SNA_07255 [Streptomyces natalensis ATCC 27448]
MFSKHGAAVALSSRPLVGSSMVWAPAGQAHGPEHRESVLCTGSSAGMYDPPLTLLPRKTRVRTHAGYDCTVAPGRTMPATGYLEGESPSASCVQLDGPHLKEVVKYADGKRSLIAYSSGTSVRVADLLIARLSGRVVEGRGEGRSAQRTVSALSRQLPTECLSSGLTGSTGKAQLEIGS